MKFSRKVIVIISVILATVLVSGAFAVSAAISPGAKGSNVTSMQKKLIALGYLLDSADGSYGPATKAAVKSFESANGLTADGIADDTMLAKLTSNYNSAPRMTVTASSLNVRKGAGTSYAKLGAVKKGSSYVVIGKKTVSGTTWYNFIYGIKSGWVSGQYVTYKAGSTTSSTAASTTAKTTAAVSTVTKGTVTASALNVRSGAGTNYSKVTTLAKGSVITITGSKTVSGVKWYSYVSGGKTLWVCGTYVTVKTYSVTTTTTKSTTTTTTTTTASSATTTKPTTAPTSVNKTYKYGVVNVNTSLNVRKGAGTSYAKLGSLADDEMVVIDGKNSKSGWYKVVYGNTFGWISSSYVSLIDESSTKITHTEGDAAEQLADKLLSEMSVEEKVGQLLLPRLGSMSESSFRSLISDCKVGGIVLFKADFEGKTKQEVINLIKSYQNAAGGKLLVCVDEEGGTVVRLSGLTALRSAKFQSPQNLYKLGGYELIEADTINKSAFLRSFGVNVNLGPVSDVTTSSKGYMYSRAFGKGAEDTGKYVSTVVSAMDDRGVGSCMKHFPGYGNSTADTHEGFDHNTKSLNELISSDLVPFKMGIESGADSIMMTHTIIDSVDSDCPASLSKECTDLVRNELGFDGVIITDGLGMGAIKDYCGSSDPCVEAILGGCDMLCNPSNTRTSYKNLLTAVSNGTITEERLDESVKRILLWKIELGLYN